MEPTKILKVKESISVPLSQGEIATKASLAAKLHEEIEAKEAEAKESAADYKAQIQTLRNQQASALRCVRTGKEFVNDAPCEQLFFLEENRCEIWYDGQKISERTITPKERALIEPSIFDHAKVDPKAGLPVDLSLPGMPETGAPFDEDLHQVIKQETNRKTKKDLLK